MTAAKRGTLVMAASTRTNSINGALAQRIADVLNDRGERAEVLDLTEFDMPMYQGDLEQTEGVPPSAQDLVARFADADRVVIVTPEYNGAFPPLLKNTIDWMSRVERGFMSHVTVHLAAATPGGLGGTRVLAILRTWLDNMRIDVAPETLSVPRAQLADDGSLVTESEINFDSFLPAPTR